MVAVSDLWFMILQKRKEKGEILSDSGSDEAPRKRRGRRDSSSEPEVDSDGNPIPKRKKKRR